MAAAGTRKMVQNVPPEFGPTMKCQWAFGCCSNGSQSASLLVTLLKRVEKRYEPAGASNQEFPDFVQRNGWFSATRSYVKAILCLLAFHEPKSFGDGPVVRLSNDWLKRANSKNYHHFFPKAYLAKQGVTETRANHIANITIVGDYLNKRQIGARAPSDYMTAFARDNDRLEDVMDTHLISLSDSGIWADYYEVFLTVRCQRIARELAKRIVPQAIYDQTQQLSSDDYEDIELEDVAKSESMLVGSVNPSWYQSSVINSPK
jgi:hypothetical protein